MKITDFLKKSAGTQSTEVKSEPKKKYMGAGFLELGTKKLSDQKSASAKLINAATGWVYINSSRLAEEVSKLELKLYQTGYSQGQLTLAEIETHPLLDLLDRFNDSNSSTDAYYTTEAHLNPTGSSFWYLANIRNGQPESIFLLDPTKMKIKLGDITDSSSRLIDGYEYKDVVDGKQVTINYTPEEIIQIKVPDPSKPLS